MLLICAVRKRNTIDLLKYKPEEKLWSANLLCLTQMIPGNTLFSCLICQGVLCYLLSTEFPFVIGVAAANFSVVRLLRLSRFKLEHRNSSHHQEGCGFGEQEYNFFRLTKIAGLSTESSKLLGISPVLVTGSRDHHQPPSPSESGERRECDRARS